MSSQRVVRFTRILAQQYKPYINESEVLKETVKELEKPKKKPHHNKINDILELHKRLNKIRVAIKDIESKNPEDVLLKKLKQRYQHIDKLIIKKLKAE